MVSTAPKNSARRWFEPDIGENLDARFGETGFRPRCDGARNRRGRRLRPRP